MRKFSKSNDNDSRIKSSKARKLRLSSSNCKKSNRSCSQDDPFAIEPTTKPKKPKFFFGTEFIKEERDHVHSPYSVLCKTDCHFLTLSKKSFQTLLERIAKRQQKQEIATIRKIRQFTDCGTKMLIRLHGCRVRMAMKRNQYLFKEGDSVDRIYIIGTGQFQQTKTILEKKSQNVERELLVQQTATTTQRFNNMFKSRHGVRKMFEVRIVEFGAGRMIGDSECVQGIDQYQTSVICVDQEATVYSIKK